MVKFRSYFERHYPKLERTIATIALINLGLVFFDLSYLSLRPVYRQYLPAITHIYDPVKGIVTHPQTEAYQAQVDVLSQQLAAPNPQPSQMETSLSNLRSWSQPLMTERVFTTPNGDDTLATLQQALQARTGQRSAQAAFNRFWSADYLSQRGWQPELTFWNSQIRPFFEANYYRQMTALGVPVDYFWLIDLPFVLIFAVDIINRIRVSHRRNAHLTWVEATLRRWYDLFLLLPFWRGLRVLPVALRLYQVDMLNLEPVRAEAQRDVVVTVGVDIAGIAGIEIIEQMQDSIRKGDLLGLTAWIDPTTDVQSDVEIVAEEEITAIAHRLYKVGIQDVLPQVQPDLEDLVQHSIATTLEQLPGYPQMNHVPGLERLSREFKQGLSLALARGLYRTFTSSLSDQKGEEISTRLQHNFRNALAMALSQSNTRQEIESRLISALEKFKLNYVKSLTEAGGEKLAERTELLRKQIS
ncbi:hypothetical protein C7293_15100 [filamentous cyanobacterium CCT1]|nr:hypothetical protein C7293_15100 [filamentous cyanobacterium CCT1]PSN80248.1 hypothetical protein C8B47_07425 [filamentous cyanobacterium CCP4]